MERQNRLRENLESAFTLIFRKWTNINCINLEGLPNWEAVEDSSNVINILKMVKSLLH